MKKEIKINQIIKKNKENLKIRTNNLAMQEVGQVLTIKDLITPRTLLKIIHKDKNRSKKNLKE